MDASFCVSLSGDALAVLDAPSDDLHWAPRISDEDIRVEIPSLTESEPTPEESQRKRRPLSPICHHCSVDEIPQPLGRIRKVLNDPRVQRVWPWCFSMTVHAAVVISGLLSFEMVTHRPKLDHVIDGMISSVPAAAGAVVMPPTAAPEGLLQLAGGSVERDRESSQPHDPTERANAFDSVVATRDSRDIVNSPPENEEPLVLGVSPNSSGVLALKSDRGARSVGSDSQASVSAPATNAKFFGISGNARSVIYLCDASGSMQGTDETIATQLQRAVISLAPSQEFNVIFFSSGATPLTLSRELLAANPNNKTAACNFAKSFSCSGKTNALAAVQAAMRYKPDMLYLVTDGAFDQAEGTRLLTAMRELNTDRATKVNVIVICGAAAVDVEGYPALRQLADDSGGTCRVINPNSL